MASQWEEFYDRTAGQPHWPLVERAADLHGGPGHAVDLGCGAGRDTRYLLGWGWTVTALDQEPAALARLAGLPADRLHPVLSRIEDFTYPDAPYDLISAQFALPFIPPPHLPAALGRLVAALRPGGLLAGQFFGPHDAWNAPGSHMTFLPRAAVDRLLRDLTVLELTEEENDGPTAAGPVKHWHVFHVLARRDR